MLKYIGSGFLPGIPKRDLSDAEVDKFTDEPHLQALGLSADEISAIKSGKEFLIGTGLYKYVKGITAAETAAAALPEYPAGSEEPVEPEKEGE
jgi:hypothetical protein